MVLDTYSITFPVFLREKSSLVNGIVCDHHSLEKCTQEAHIFPISLLACYMQYKRK